MKTFKLIIAGSREFANYDFLKERVDHLLCIKRKIYLIEIVSGTAKGADILGERYAKEHDFLIKRFVADWKEGKKAGYLRNIQMAEYADACICFWDGTSKGTKHMINIANARKIPIRVIYLNTKNNS